MKAEILKEAQELNKKLEPELSNVFLVGAQQLLAELNKQFDAL